MSPKPEWVSVASYCTIYGLHRNTVYKYMDNGLLEMWQVGRVLRVKNEPPAEAKKTRAAR